LINFCISLKWNFSSQRTFKSQIQDKKWHFLLDLSKFCIIHNLIYSYKHKCPPPPKACIRGKQWSSHLQYLLQNLWPPSMITILKEGRPPYSYSNSSSKSAFPDARLATEVIFFRVHDIVCRISISWVYISLRSKLTILHHSTAQLVALNSKNWKNFKTNAFVS